jgi:hypothetical protein
MSTLSLDTKIYTAVEMMIWGADWNKIARQLECPVSECQLWPCVHREKWAEALAACRHWMLLHAQIEGIILLRYRLRSKDHRISIPAAKILLGLNATKNTRMSGPSMEQLQTRFHRETQQLLEELSDEELTRKIREWDELAAGTSLAPPDPTGPNRSE